MTPLAFIIGTIIIGLCLIVGCIILSGAINGAARELNDNSSQTLAQPTLAFLTEYDAADYLGISLNELDYMRSEGLLDGAFVAVTSLEQTGEETYADIIDGVENIKTRPVLSNVTRFLFNRELLDSKMCEIMKSGSHINPVKGSEKKPAGKPSAPSGHPGMKPGNQAKGVPDRPKSFEGRPESKPENRPESKPESRPENKPLEERRQPSDGQKRPAGAPTGGAQKRPGEFSNAQGQKRPPMQGGTNLNRPKGGNPPSKSGMPPKKPQIVNDFNDSDQVDVVDIMSARGGKND